MIKVLFAIVCTQFLCNQIFSQVTVTGSNSANGSYATLKQAFDKINLYPQSSNNILITVSGNTIETSTATLEESSSSWNSLKVVASSNATISGNISGALVSLNGADNVVIDGFNVTGNLVFDNASTAVSASTVQFINDASENKVTNCIIKGSSTGDNSNVTYGGVVWFYTGITSGNDNDTISNCDIGPSGSNLPFMTVRGYGTAGKENDGIIISDNNIHDFFCSASATGTTGIYAGSYNNAWSIRSNKFYQSAARTYSIASSEYRVIYVANTSLPGGDYTIEDNVIGYSSSTGIGVTTISGSSNMIRGIYIKTASNAAASVITGNTVTAILQTTSKTGSTVLSSSPFVGIAGDAAGSLTISDNVIGAASGTGSITINQNLNSFSAILTYVTAIFTSGTAAHTISNNVIGSITMNKLSNFEWLSFNGIRTEGSGAVSILSNQVGNSTTQNIFSNFPAGQLSGLQLNNSATTMTADGNTISNFYLTGTTTSGNNYGQIFGIDLLTPSGTVTISNNSINNLVYNGSHDAGYVVIGIQTAGPSSAIYHVTANHIFALRNLYASGFIYSYIHGMVFNHSGTTGHTISDNEIYDLTIAAGGYVIAILMFDAGYTLTNNMMTIGYGLPVNESIGCYGIYFLAFSYPGYFYYNTVLLGGSSVVAGNYNLAMNLSSLNANSKLLNNIVINDRVTGSPNNDQAIYIGTSGALNITMDHNNLYVNPSIPYIVKKVSSGYGTLAAWQSAYGKDLNSISTPLTFTDPQSDLHATTDDCSLLSGLGIPVAGITEDIDGDVRDPVSPDIGADECMMILPIELASFNAEVTDASIVRISWTTQSEMNNDHFEIERSGDLQQFQSIGKVEGALFSIVPKAYYFEDQHPLYGQSYYRLKQVDEDSSITYSSVIAVEIIGENPIAFYPNPVHNILMVSKSPCDINQCTALTIYDMTGHLVLQKCITSCETSLDLTSFPPGVYFISARDGDYIMNTRMVKQ